MWLLLQMTLYGHLCVGHSSNELCNNSWTDREAVWEAGLCELNVLDGVQIPHKKGHFLKGKGHNVEIACYRPVFWQMR